MVLDEAKEKFGLAKWSTNYKAKQEAGRVFMKNKELMLDVMLSNIHPLVVQQMKGIKEYKQVEKKKDLIGTLRILKDICFADQNGGLSFQPMTCLGQCNNSLNFKQFQLSDAAYKENFCTFYEALKSQTGKASVWCKVPGEHHQRAT